MKLDATPVCDNVVKKKNTPVKKSNSKANAKVSDVDVIKAKQSTCSADQHYTSGPLEQPLLAGTLGMQPDPLLLVALHASRPRLLTLDDLLAARSVCKAWKQRLGTAFCHSIRLPHSLWHEASNKRIAATITAAAAAYPHASTLILDAGGCRPALQPSIWHPLLNSIQPWLMHNSNSSPRCIHLRLSAVPSANRLEALQCLELLTHLTIQHTSQSLYSRHLAAIASLTQLQSLVFVQQHPKLDLRNMAHQRVRRTPLKMDCLSSLVGLTRLELDSRAFSGEILPDTVAAFSNPASLAALSNLCCLSLSEAALPGPNPATDWLQSLSKLTQLMLVHGDDAGRTPGKGRGTVGSPACGTAAAAGNLASSILGSGNFGALAAAAAAAGRGSAAEQLLQQQALLPAILSGSSGGSFSRTGSVSATAAASAAGVGTHEWPAGGAAGRASSSSSSVSDADAAAAAAEVSLLPALDFASTLPSLSVLTVANVGGERLVQLKIPSGLTRLSVHLANPCPGAVTGEQLAGVIMQSSQTLVSLELGLGMRFSLTGTVMRNLKRGLKSLKDLTLVEGSQDHLEGLGCWCNLRRLELVEGRCPVPLRGLYELSMRAAMGRTPGVLRYTGHVRHVDELAGRLGGALKELRLGSLGGFGFSRTSSNSGGGSGCDTVENPGGILQTPGSCNASEADGQGVPALHQLLSLTRLEIVGDRIGQLEVGIGQAIAQLRSVVVLEIRGQESWLLPELGVKEQLGWLRGLTQLRLLRLGGIMLGRSKLAGCPNSSSSTNTAVGSSEKGSSASSRSSSSSRGPGTVPPVKGLGNGLASSSPSAASSNKGAAGAAGKDAAAEGLAISEPVLNPAAAAARDLAVSMALEEVRRWLCQMLPYCRVWLD